MGGPGLTADSVVNAWTGDDPHLNTMLSTNLREVGAGVSCAGDYCYYTLDAAQSSGGSVGYTPPVGGATLTPFNPGTIVPTHGIIIQNTPDANGSIQYVVQDGDTLFTISIAYKVSVDDLKRLNRLGNNLIYVGDVLTIRTAGKPVTATITETITPAPTFTPFVFWTVTSPPTLTATPVPSAPVAGGSGTVVVGVIVVAALVLAGVFTATGAKKRAP
jgi:LysM repeat protein